METRHPIGGQFGREFSAFVIIVELWRPEIARPGNFVSTFCAFFFKRPLSNCRIWLTLIQISSKSVYFRPSYCRTSEDGFCPVGYLQCRLFKRIIILAAECADIHRILTAINSDRDREKVIDCDKWPGWLVRRAWFATDAGACHWGQRCWWAPRGNCTYCRRSTQPELMMLAAASPTHTLSWDRALCRHADPCLHNFTALLCYLVVKVHILHFWTMSFIFLQTNTGLYTYSRYEHFCHAEHKTHILGFYLQQCLMEGCGKLANFVQRCGYITQIKSEKKY